ncbi:hypothetical protein BDW59DRAFT_148684 [Aspergillus cavernicola]|uniref:Uncharacterized protein n=1 Tax=Aspergillus cavernicola TaxID=176166 RepID=A0ABR4I6V6_9EURO
MAAIPNIDNTPSECHCSHHPNPTPTPDTTVQDAAVVENSDNDEIPDRRGRLPVRIRPNRLASRSPESTYSPARIRITRRNYSPNTTLRFISSHHELFSISTPQSDDQNQNQPQNKDKDQDTCVLLAPFNREAYITTHPASPFDFTYWLPLLSLGTPETWYAFSTPEATISTSLYQHLVAPPAATLRPQLDPRPVGLRFPRISASPALQPSRDPIIIPATIKTESGIIEQPVSLIYLSIQQSISGHSTQRGGRWVSPDRSGLPDVAGRSITGQNIYRVVRTGSREEAASQAFYNAGGNRWSTVFTCVVVGGKRALSGRVMVLQGGYERVASLQELVDTNGEGREGRMTVFY